MHNRFIRTLLPVLALTAAAGAAQAETELLYQCGGDLGIVVTTYPESGTGRFDGNYSADLVPDGQGAWVNEEHELQFWPEGEEPTLFVGVEQFSCQAFADDPGMNAGAEPVDAATAEGGIINTAEMEMAPYADVRGWEVSSLNSGPNFMGCAASIEQPSGFLILQKKDYGWELRVPADQTEGFDGGVLVVDGYVVDAQFGFTPEGAGEAGLDDSFIARLKQGSRLTTQINGSEPINWALKGSAAVVTKIEECYTNQGVLP